MDPVGAQEEVLQLVSELGLSVTVAVAYEVPESCTGASLLRQFPAMGFVDLIRISGVDAIEIIVNGRCPSKAW